MYENVDEVWILKDLINCCSVAYWGMITHSCVFNETDRGPAMIDRVPPTGPKNIF